LLHLGYRAGQILRVPFLGSPYPLVLSCVAVILICGEEGYLATNTSPKSSLPRATGHPTNHVQYIGREESAGSTPDVGQEPAFADQFWEQRCPTSEFSEAVRSAAFHHRYSLAPTKPKLERRSKVSEALRWLPTQRTPRNLEAYSTRDRYSDLPFHQPQYGDRRVVE